MGMSSLIVIGAGYAGLLAARRASASGLGVTLVSERGVMVDRIRLHEVVAGIRSLEEATRPLSLPTGEVVVGRVTRVEEGQVTLADGRTRTADHVLIATGSGYDIGGWDWAMAHRSAVVALAPGATVQVLGAGLTGVETAAELAAARPDLRVVLVAPDGVRLNLDPRGDAVVAATLATLGVTVTDTADTAGADVDHTIACTGLTVDPLARDSGLPTSPAGAVLVDEALRVVGRERLWACGDAASVAGRPYLRMGCATAQPMAAAAADNIVGAVRGRAPRPLSLGYAARCVSLGRSAGLIQFVTRADEPTARVWSGRRAAVAKELVCRYATAVPVRWANVYRGLEGPHG